MGSSPETVSQPAHIIQARSIYRVFSSVRWRQRVLGANGEWTPQGTDCRGELGPPRSHIHGSSVLAAIGNSTGALLAPPRLVITVRSFQVSPSWVVVCAAAGCCGLPGRT